jgi:hypothetical protein
MTLLFGRLCLALDAVVAHAVLVQAIRIDFQRQTQAKLLVLERRQQAEAEMEAYRLLQAGNSHVYRPTDANE